MSNCLYLVSSSASREYVMDCVEALALPRGLVMHFRYLHKYIDDHLRTSLPQELGELPADLKDLPVVVVYLCQTQKAGVWERATLQDPEGTHLPIRYGRLLNAFTDGSVAHFYFEVTDYVQQKDENGSSARSLLNQTVKFKTTYDKKDSDSFAHIGPFLKMVAPGEEESKAFQQFVLDDTVFKPGEWRTRSLGSAPLDVTYEVVFFRIVGVFREANRVLDLISPVRRNVRGSVIAEYEFEVGRVYYIQLVTQLPMRSPSQLPGKGVAELALRYDDKLMEPIGRTTLTLSSFYDLEYWSLKPKGAQSSRTSVAITCQHDVRVNREQFLRKELLCPEVVLPIAIALSKA